MKSPFSVFLALAVCAIAHADPFADPAGQVKEVPEETSPFDSPRVETAKPYAKEVDYDRGTLSLNEADGEYTPGSHFATWRWTLDAPRWGNYHVSLRYASDQGKLGVNVKIGEEVVKSYAPRSGGVDKIHNIVLGTIYIPKQGEYPVSLLTGDLSQGPSFFVKGVDLIPAPESDEVGHQGIDGSITLLANEATTYSNLMRYEPKPEKNCLGWWVEEGDWAEWELKVSQPGKFKVAVTQGCGEGKGGSEVALLVNGQTLDFTVKDTGGFQNWETQEIGTVELKHSGTNRIALVPQSKADKAVMDLQKVTLTPVK